MIDWSLTQLQEMEIGIHALTFSSHPALCLSCLPHHLPSLWVGSCKCIRIEVRRERWKKAQHLKQHCIIKKIKRWVLWFHSRSFTKTTDLRVKICCFFFLDRTLSTCNHRDEEMLILPRLQAGPAKYFVLYSTSFQDKVQGVMD